MDILTNTTGWPRYTATTSPVGNRDVLVLQIDKLSDVIARHSSLVLRETTPVTVDDDHALRVSVAAPVGVPESQVRADLDRALLDSELPLTEQWRLSVAAVAQIAVDSAQDVRAAAKVGLPWVTVSLVAVAVIAVAIVLK